MRSFRRRNALLRGYTAYGVDVAVEVSDPDLWPAIEEILPPVLSPRQADDAQPRFVLEHIDEDSYGFTMNGSPWIEHVALTVAVGALDQQLRLHIAAHAPAFIFVHAGCVALGEQAVVIPGRSFSGKTTLVRALVEAGAIYMSDEYALLDGDGRVHPYARRLSIRGRNGEPARERHVSELGGVAATQSARVALVLLTRYRADATWQPEPRTAGDGVIAMLANTVPAQERPRESLRAVSQAVRGARVLESDRGDADETAQLVLAALAAS